MKNKNIIKSITNATLSLIILSGCASQVPSQPPAPNSVAAKINYLGDLPYISINDLRMSPVNNFKIVNADIKNNDSDYANIEYRFQWRDIDGMSVGTEENWTTLQLSPMQTQRIKGTATAKEVVDFRLELKSKN
jgi:uncharacterized protein YcfL